MATLTIKNFPEDLYRKLKESAMEHRRSINSEVIVSLERALDPRRANRADLLERARDLRRRTAGAGLSVAKIAAAKEEGRP